MIRKISLLLLVVTIFTFAFSLTSCEAVGSGIEGALTSILPDKNSSDIAKTAHDLTKWIGDQFSSFFSFNWAKRAWNWLDTTLGITEKFEQAKGAIELIKTGEFKNILTGLTTIFGCGVILLILGALALLSIVIAIIIELFAEVILIGLGIVLMVVVLVLAVLGFIFVVLPFLK